MYFVSVFIRETHITLSNVTEKLTSPENQNDVRTLSNITLVRPVIWHAIYHQKIPLAI